MYWFYTYKWKAKHSSVWTEEMDVFNGKFSELILNAKYQPETWIISYTKEISEDDFNALDGIVG